MKRKSKRKREQEVAWKKEKHHHAISHSKISRQEFALLYTNEEGTVKIQPQKRMTPTKQKKGQKCPPSEREGNEGTSTKISIGEEGEDTSATFKSFSETIVTRSPS